MTALLHTPFEVMWRKGRSTDGKLALNTTISIILQASEHVLRILCRSCMLAISRGDNEEENAEEKNL